MGLFLLSFMICLVLFAMAISVGFIFAMHVQDEIMGGARELFRLLYPLLHW